MHPVQVWLNEQVTIQNVDPDFSLTGEPLGNKIQLPSFDGCDSVETDSPIEHHPGRTGEIECSPFGVSISVLDQGPGAGASGSCGRGRGARMTERAASFPWPLVPGPRPLS